KKPLQRKYFVWTLSEGIDSTSKRVYGLEIGLLGDGAPNDCITVIWAGPGMSVLGVSWYGSATAETPGYRRWLGGDGAAAQLRELDRPSQRAAERDATSYS